METEVSQTKSTYRAMQAVGPGRLELTEKALIGPPPGHVRIRVEACGVCHSDALTVEGVFPIKSPRVPGHEAIGRIDALGPGVEGWSVGQRVGVGFLAGPCGRCQPCRGGDLVNCQNQGFTGVENDGGYAEVMIAKATGLVHVPHDLGSADAAPLLCAGLTTFSALRNGPAKAGDLVAVLGLGGLGHLGVQYARHMGFEVVAIGRGADKAELAMSLGAHHYIDSAPAQVSQALQDLGGATLVLATASAGKAAADAIKGLRPRGHVIALGLTPDPIEVRSTDLLSGNHSIDGAMTGDLATADATLKFSSLTGVAAMIETMPLEQAAQAYARMMSGKARFRIVLTMSG
jgi:propanol-preferring alcohol dehydrogenase